jgi:hypothetical protein
MTKIMTITNKKNHIVLDAPFAIVEREAMTVRERSRIIFDCLNILLMVTCYYGIYARTHRTETPTH